MCFASKVRCLEMIYQDMYIQFRGRTNEDYTDSFDVLLPYNGVVLEIANDGILGFLQDQWRGLHGNSG